MPAQQCLRPNDQDSVQYRRKPAIQLDEELAVAVGELDTTALLSLQHDYLLPECGILGRKLALALEEQAKQVRRQQQECDHRD